MSTPYEDDVAVIWASLQEMQSNVGYMRREQVGLAMPDAVRADLGKVLGEFDSLLYDLRTETRNLEDKLGLHPGEAPNDPGIVNPDPRVTMGFLREWPRESFLMLDAVVRELAELAEGDQAAGIVYILVAESAVNMLNANTAQLEALERIGATLEKAGR